MHAVDATHPKLVLACAKLHRHIAQEVRQFNVAGGRVDLKLTAIHAVQNVLETGVSELEKPGRVIDDVCRNFVLRTP